MALSLKSLAEVAQKRARRARASIQRAEARLKVANSTLERAIPNGHAKAIEDAHEDTKCAEHAVQSANEDLQVVEELLDTERSSDSAQYPSHATGEGLKSLVEMLRNPHRR